LNLLPVAIPLGVASVLIVFHLVRRHERERSETLRNFARGGGFEFAAQGDLAGFPTHLLKHGRRRRMRNVMTRTDPDGETLVFDHEYLRQAGKNSSWDRETVYCARRDRRSLPVFQLRPENVLDRIASALGWKDIDFDSRPDFSRMYLLRGPDDAAIRQVFGVEPLAFLEKHPGWHVEGEAGWVAVYRKDRRVAPDSIAEFLDEARQVDELFRA
jgi:hypothetical protein